MSLSRRELFRWMGSLAVVLAVPACGGGGGKAMGDSVFTADELDALARFADVILPEDDQPGGAKLGTVAYIEQLIAAFASTPPAIYGNGPFSDRNPIPDATGQPTASFPTNDFATFVELDRVAKASWLLFVQGSAALPGGAPNEALLGPVVALEDQLKAGLDAAIANAPQPLANMTADELETYFNGQPEAFTDLLIELVTEAAFAAPEYGGNPGLAGWDMIHFEGDSLPLGYSQWNGTAHVERPEAPLSTPNPGADPEPLDDDVHQLLVLVVEALAGRMTT